MKHTTEGKQLYVLVQTKNLPINLPEIYIAGSNACNNGKSNEEEGSEEEGSSDSEDSESNEDVPKRLELKIKVYNITVELKPKHKVFVSIKSLLTLRQFSFVKRCACLPTLESTYCILTFK